MSSGLGVYLAPNRRGHFIVTKMAPGGPAMQSGQVQLGDVVVQVNGQSLEGMLIENARGLIMGPVGTDVQLTLMRNGVLLGASLRRGPAQPEREVSPHPQQPGYTPGRQMSPPPPGARPNQPPPLLQQPMVPSPWSTDAQGNVTRVVPFPIQQSPYPQGQPSASPYPQGQTPQAMGMQHHQQQRELSPGSRPGPAYTPQQQLPMGGGGYYQSPAPQLFKQQGVLGMTPQAQQPQGRSTSAPVVNRGAGQFGMTPQMERGRQPYRGPSQSPMQHQGYQTGGGRRLAYSQSPMPGRMAAHAGGGQCGLGVTLRNDRNGDLRVVEIARGGPAARQGTLRRGDVITSVNGVNVRGMGVVQARDLIMGPESTPCMIGAYREANLDPNGMGGQMQFNIIRGRTDANAAAQQQQGRPSHSPMARPQMTPQQQQQQQQQQQRYQTPDQQRHGQRPAVVRQLQPGGQAPVNEAMCGIGAFIERGDHGHLVIKNITPDGPASHNRDVYPGDFIVGIDGGGTQGMSMMQVRNKVIGRRGTPVTLSLQRPMRDGNGNNVLSHIFEVSIHREPPKQPSTATPMQPPQHSYPPQAQSQQGSFPPGSFPGHGAANAGGVGGGGAGTGSSPPYSYQPDPYNTGDLQTISQFNASQSAGPYSSNAAPPLLQQQQQQQMMMQQPVQQQQQQTAPPLLPQHQPGYDQQQYTQPQHDPGAPPPGAKCGIGIELIEFDGALIVQKVYPNGPAERSGLVMKGDLLHRLDYRTVSELTKETVRPMLFGDRGSSVVLGLIKPKFRLRVNVRLQREYVAEESHKAGFAGGAAAAQAQQPQQQYSAPAQVYGGGGGSPYRGTDPNNMMGSQGPVYRTMDGPAPTVEAGAFSSQPGQGLGVGEYGDYAPNTNFEAVMSDFDGPPSMAPSVADNMSHSSSAHHTPLVYPKAPPQLPRVSGPDVVL